MKKIIIFVMCCMLILGGCGTGGNEEPVTETSETKESVTSTSSDCQAINYETLISGEPGLLTLKNFIATALAPVGTTLYIYGGGWNYEDTGADENTTSIGVAESWMDFFYEQDENYDYEEDGYYPTEGVNTYHAQGLDCSGFVGWAVYNLINTESGGEGLVISSVKQAKSFADAGYGSLSQDVSTISCGDIVSIKGHAWICLGVCDDGSLVIIHSTPSDSTAGASGGGVQIGALDPEGDADCQAYDLASEYMSNYDEWSSRYSVPVRDYAMYTDFSGAEEAGIFSWDCENYLTDPDGYEDMSADEILADLYGE